MDYIAGEDLRPGERFTINPNDGKAYRHTGVEPSYGLIRSEISKGDTFTHPPREETRDYRQAFLMRLEDEARRGYATKAQDRADLIRIVRELMNRMDEQDDYEREQDEYR